MCPPYGFQFVFSGSSILRKSRGEKVSFFSFLIKTKPFKPEASLLEMAGGQRGACGRSKDAM